jgi:hypothetical protein
MSKRRTLASTRPSHETNARLVDTTERLDMRLDHLAEGQIRLATTLTGELRHLGDRIDNLLVGSMGALVRDHEAGLFRIEQKLNER